MMKKAVMMIACLFIFAGTALAQDSGFGVSVGYGQGQDSIDIYRIGLMKKWNVQWVKSHVGYIDGYFELSYNRWEGHDNDINAVAISPVFQYAFNSGNNSWYPYIEGGVGVVYLDEYHINDRDLSSNLQFEDRIGVGFRFNNLDLNFRYMHYSNGSLKEPNDGIDILIGTLSCYF